MAEEKFYTRLEIEIQGFISKYGVDELIKWLREYSKIVSTSDFNTFHRIQRYTCEVYEIAIADISSSNSTNINYSNAKKTISYLSYTKTKLQQKHLTMLQSCTTRTIYNHIKEVQFRIKNPQGFREFIEKYNFILKKLEDHVNNP
jgi:hypothetical protein